MDLLKQRCKPCEGGVLPMAKAHASEYMTKLSKHWKLSEDGLSISCTYTLKDFIKSMQLVNSVAAIAEEEAHHPDIAISYATVQLTLTTHAISGLSINDFIVAAKIDAIKKE